MGCKLCEEKLLDHLYGELDETDRALMEKHLAASPACMETYRSFQSIRKTVSKEGEEELPQGLHTRIMAHAAEHGASVKKGAAWARLFRPALATTVVAVAAGIIYMQTSRFQGLQQQKHAMLMEESLDQEMKEMRFARSFKPEEGYDRLESLGGAQREKDIRDHVSTESRKGIPPGAGEDTGEAPGPSSIQLALNRMPEPSRLELHDGLKGKEAGLPSASVPVLGDQAEEVPEAELPAKATPRAVPPSRSTFKGTASAKKSGDIKIAGQAADVSMEAKGSMVTKQEFFEMPIEKEVTAGTSPPFLAAQGKPSEGIAQRVDDEAEESEIRLTKSRVMSKVASTTPPPVHQAPEVRLPDRLARATELAKQGRCEEALPHVEAFAAKSPKEPASGLAWLELARCFQGKGNEDSARKAAIKASEIPETAGEAQALLQTLGAKSD